MNDLHVEAVVDELVEQLLGPLLALNEHQQGRCESLVERKEGGRGLHHYSLCVEGERRILKGNFGSGNISFTQSLITDMFSSVQEVL